MVLIENNLGVLGKVFLNFLESEVPLLGIRAIAGAGPLDSEEHFFGLQTKVFEAL